MTKINSIRQFKGCTDKEITDALQKLAAPMLNACGDNKEMINHILSLAITGWNLSLFPNTDKGYIEDISKKLPPDIPAEKQKIFSGFVMQIIQQKKNEYADMMKGITDFKTGFEKEKITLSIKTLPVKPKER